MGTILGGIAGALALTLFVYCIRQSFLIAMLREDAEELAEIKAARSEAVARGNRTRAVQRAARVAAKTAELRAGTGL